MATIGAPSRFAVLKMDVAEPNDRRKPKTSQPQKIQMNGGGNQKQKPKQKPKENKAKKAKTPKNETQQTEEKTFSDWKRKDEKTTEDLFEKELQEALLQSRLEQKPQVHQAERKLSTGESVDVRKKGTFSLQEFNEMYGKETASSSPPGLPEPLSKLLSQRKQEEAEEERLRESASNQAAAIIRREKIQQEILEKQSHPATVLQSEYDQMLEMKKKQIEHMAKVLCTTKKELAVALEQNADMESLLKKGELKKKVELLREVGELRQLRDELTDQLQDMSIELERERSKNHELVQELLKRR